MNEYFAEGGWTEMTALELANAKDRVNSGFDRLSTSISSGVDFNAGLGESEIALLLEVVEEKRAAELSAEMSMNRIRLWQGTGRARSILLTDPRATRVYNALNTRRLADAEPPLRYFGFADEGGFRVFEFGRLPKTESSEKYRVSVSLAFFLRNQMVLQDGPGFCAGLLSRRGNPNDCVASQEDLDEFLASRASKAAMKSRPRPRYGTNV
jgi:hypothetical protein